MAAWEPRVNLSGARNAEQRVARLVAPVLAWAARVPGPQAIDIGSGNGSPGLVLAVLRPDLQLTLLEPRQKRWAFLREASRVLGRLDLQILRSRHDQYSGPAVDAVLLRALQLPGRELWPLLRPGGLWVQIGLPPREAESFAVEPDWAPDVHVLRRCST